MFAFIHVSVQLTAHLVYVLLVVCNSHKIVLQERPTRSQGRIWPVE